MASAATDSTKPQFTPVPTPPESGAASAASTPSFQTAEQDDRGVPMDVDDTPTEKEPAFPTPPTTEPGSATTDAPPKASSRDSNPEQASSSKGKQRAASPTPAATPDVVEEPEPEAEPLDSRLAKLDLKDLGDGSQFTVAELNVSVT